MGKEPAVEMFFQRTGQQSIAEGIQIDKPYLLFPDVFQMRPDIPAIGKLLQELPEKGLLFWPDHNGGGQFPEKRLQFSPFFNEYNKFLIRIVFYPAQQKEK